MTPRAALALLVTVALAGCEGGLDSVSDSLTGDDAAPAETVTPEGSDLLGAGVASTTPQQRSADETTRRPDTDQVVGEVWTADSGTPRPESRPGEGVAIVRGEDVATGGAVPSAVEGRPPLTPPTPERMAAAQEAPHVYMSLQPNGSRPVSIVFAIDAARNGDPGDDPAIRLTPQDGQCNPQELRGYRFPPADTALPAFGPKQVLDGLTARDLPSFLAVEVTNRMLADNLATDREQTRGQNICTRKLWEQLILSHSRAEG